MSSVLPSVTWRISSTARSVSAAAHARGRLVEQDDVGAAGDGDADLERALLGIGEHAGRHVAARGEVDLVQDLLGALAHVGAGRRCRCQNE